MSTSTEADSIPMLPPDDSPGSSISSSLQEEYQELLQYAVVTPHYDPSQLPHTLAGAAQSFQPQRQIKDQLIYLQSSDESSSVSEPSAKLGESMVATHGSQNGEEPPTDSQDEGSRDQELRRRDLTAPVNEFRSPVRSYPPEELGSSTPPSTDQSTLTNQSSSPGSPVMDQDLVRMEKLLDNWSLELKRGVLAELSQAKMQVIEKSRVDARLHEKRSDRDLRRVQNEIENQKELLHTFEQSVERKDHIISNLTRAVQKEKDRFQMLRRFESWKLRHSEDRRQVFTMKLAKRHHEKHLKSKVWSAWHSIIVAKWRQRVEKACQTKAQEVCMKLTNDYEARLASLNEALEAARAEVTKLHGERDYYEESMKKAFMRGVCALNMEAMAMFHDGEEGSGQPQPSFPPSAPTPAAAAPVPTAAPARPSPSVNTTLLGRSKPNSQPMSSQSQRGSVSAVKKTATWKSSDSKTVTARVSGMSDLKTSSGLNPPMASVVVERHHPITQQTLGHATASRYPMSTTQSLPSHLKGAASKSGSSMPSRKQPTAVTGAPTVKVVH
ncbi:LOW QUALITY PROTEIN: centrosomal protein POC5-like [Lytechinus variegatus]|uniref:LOW QUALITY PROTEIN: centrosomal protein POC5-like n=1 Tax=Lytechinus variegatus TaxID=7654 RepID=UPI001BB297AA|nr:LOW QUALITY PROTEIN: centrosomal protein POC5-like [Lytechinus variegatus]